MTIFLKNIYCFLGLILRELIPFDDSSLVSYRQAGYRGVIKNGFFTSGALVHVFMKGKQLDPKFISQKE